MAANFTGEQFGNKVPGFKAPTQLPRDEAERRSWQAANRAWWQATPMRYDWREDISHEPGGEAYFKEIDRRFFTSAHKALLGRQQPFDTLIPFDELKDKDVLEIGVGQGSHAQLIAPHCKSFTGIDLTPTAAAMTAKRLQVFGLPGAILEMDAEEMSFPAESFDYIWSWGVIHHSADTQRILREMRRVLRPNGTATVMVYHRSWWNYYVVSGFLRGLVRGQLRDHGSIHSVCQSGTDGAIARHYTPREWEEGCRSLLTVDWIRIYGLKTDILPLPHGRLKSGLEQAIPDSFAHVLLHRLGLGSFLVAHMRKA
jgi:SAM-dependent methyltransferase